jgi:hypothetical protein
MTTHTATSVPPRLAPIERLYPAVRREHDAAVQHHCGGMTRSGR